MLLNGTPSPLLVLPQSWTGEMHSSLITMAPGFTGAASVVNVKLKSVGNGFPARSATPPAPPVRVTSTSVLYGSLPMVLITSVRSSSSSVK